MVNGMFLGVNDPKKVVVRFTCRRKTPKKEHNIMLYKDIALLSITFLLTILLFLPKNFCENF